MDEEQEHPPLAPAPPLPPRAPLPPYLPGSAQQPCHARYAARQTAMGRGEDMLVLVSGAGEGCWHALHDISSLSGAR